MVFKNIYTKQSSFTTTVYNEMMNSCDIERSSIREMYTNPNLPLYKQTSLKMVFISNILLEKYYNKIKSTSKKRIFSKEDNTKYRYRPEALSSDLFDTPGLWYIILKLNSCEDFSEFHDLPYVLVPSMETIKECLTNEEYILTKGNL